MGKRAYADVDEALRHLVRRLKAERRIETILLFGSRSRGDNLKFSDVDIVIVSPDFEGIGWRKGIISVARLWQGPVRLEPLCYTPKEYATRSRQISIVREAKKEGLRLA